MDVESCFELGRIDKPNGLQGTMNATIDSDIPEYYSGLESVFILQSNSLVPHFIENIKIESKGRTRIKLEEVNSVEEAEAYRSSKLFLPLDMLPSLEAGAFYYHDIVSYAIEDEKLGELGKVETVYDMKANDLLLMIYKEKEVLIPVNLIVKADHQAKKIFVNLPDGLLDIYLEE